jgi:hypothetical protein
VYSGTVNEPIPANLNEEPGAVNGGDSGFAGGRADEFLSSAASSFAFFFSTGGVCIVVVLVPKRKTTVMSQKLRLLLRPKH